MSPSKTLRTLATLASFTLLVASVHAWNAVGHMVIAAVADRGLTPEVRAEVARLAKIGATDINADPYGAAVWADDVRRDRAESAPWHYISLYFRKDGKPAVGKPAEENVVVAIRRFSAILADRSKPDAERAEALRWTMHFVGDIHQPLHAATFESDAHVEGDRGGNSYALKPAKRFADMEHAPDQMHGLWDLGVGLFPQIRRPLTPEGTATIRRQADTLIAALPPETFPERAETDPVKWADESHALAMDVAYATPEGEEPSEAYLAKGETVAARRATLAGYRLADLLNRLLGSAPRK